MIKIVNVTLNGIKNIKQGSVHFFNDSKYLKNKWEEEEGGHIIGVYGQNGSGKTALIDSFHFLYFLFSPLQNKNVIPNPLISLPSVHTTHSKISIIFYYEKNDIRAEIHYSVTFSRTNDKNSLPISLDKEQLLIKRLSPTKSLPSFDVNLDKVDMNSLLSKDSEFSVGNYIGDIRGKNSEKVFSEVLLLSNEINKAHNTLRSFLISDFFLNYLKKKEDNLSSIYATIIEKLLIQFRNNLFLYTPNDEAISNLVIGEALGHVKTEDEQFFSGSFPISFMGPQVISKKQYQIYTSLVEQINVVLPAFVPDFHVSLLKLDERLLFDGQKGMTVQLVSDVNGKQIPIAAESNGIKKILSICSALLSVFNKEDTWLVVDELDSGVFEYLLGQILEILSGYMKGQMIFTAHNLHPLEVLDKKDIFVTTTNEENRYVQLINIKPSNNKRDYYLRALLVGGQKEELYKETEASRIRLALKRGGKLIEKES